MDRIFTPFGSATTAVSVSAVNASGTLNLPGSTSDLSGSSRTANVSDVTVRVYNSTAVVVFINFNAAATTSSMPIPPGGVEVFQISPSVTTLQAITASGTGTLYATTGVGA